MSLRRLPADTTAGDQLPCVDRAAACAELESKSVPPFGRHESGAGLNEPRGIRGPSFVKRRTGVCDVARALERKTRKMACQFASQQYFVAVTLRTAYRHSQPFDLDWDSHSIERNPALQPWLSTPPVEIQVPIDDPWAAVRAGGGACLDIRERGGPGAAISEHIVA